MAPKFPSRRVPWHSPMPVLRRRNRIASISRKHGKPSADQQDAAIAAAGIQPIAEPQAPAINRELRKTLGAT